MRRHVKRAFTLIEILIVVVILGILAAIVIPQFTDASEEAMNSSVSSQLQTLRGQIELFRVQEPALAAAWNPAVDGWDQLIDMDYIQTAPANPLQTPGTGIGGGPVLGNGWVWREKTGASTTMNLYAVDITGAIEFDENGDGLDNN